MAESSYKIALMAGETFDGGLVATLMNYIRHVDRTRFKFTFYIGEEPSPSGKAELDGMGIEIVVTPSKFNVLAYTWFLVRDFRKRRFDILHANLTALNLFPLFAGWLAGIPVRISHAHSTTNPADHKQNLLKNLLRPFSHLFVTKYVACSIMSGEWLFGRRFFSRGRVQVLRNAIDLGRFSFDADARRRIRKEFGLEGKFVLGHAGRFVTQKNHTFLIDVFAEVVKRNADARLLLLGKGPLQIGIRNKVAGLELADKVIFAGERTDMDSIYSALDVYVFPSLFEGLSVALVEAQANGLPCVVSTCNSRESKLTPWLSFLTLADSVDAWANACLSAARTADKDSVAELMRQVGYDIATAAQEYEHLLQAK